MSMMSLEDIKEVIRIRKDTDWFLEYFELTVDDLVDRFDDLIREHKADLPYDLDMEQEPEEYDDR